MPKIKTHRGAAKRLKMTASGKIKRSKAFKGHLLEHKSAKRGSALRTATLVHATDHKNMRTLLPYL